MSETTTTELSLETTEFGDMNTTEKIFKKRKTKENFKTTINKASKLVMYLLLKAKVKVK
jgi:hypothetical protein